MSVVLLGDDRGDHARKGDPERERHPAYARALLRRRLAGAENESDRRSNEEPQDRKVAREKDDLLPRQCRGNAGKGRELCGNHNRHDDPEHERRNSRDPTPQTRGARLRKARREARQLLEREHNRYAVQDAQRRVHRVRVPRRPFYEPESKSGEEGGECASVATLGSAHGDEERERDQHDAEQLVDDSEQVGGEELLRRFRLSYGLEADVSRSRTVCHPQAERVTHSVGLVEAHAIDERARLGCDEVTRHDSRASGGRAGRDGVDHVIASVCARHGVKAEGSGVIEVEQVAENERHRRQHEHRDEGAPEGRRHHPLVRRVVRRAPGGRASSARYLWLRRSLRE